LLVVAPGLPFPGWCYWSAVADPVVREAEVRLPGRPAGAAPVRVVLIVTAGLGTSILPLRLPAPPDLRLVTLGPLRSAAARSPR
jgi:hypothetical protein